MALIPLSQNKQSHNKQSRDKVSARTFDLYFWPDFREPRYHVCRKFCFVSEYSIRDRIPGYQGKSIIFGFDSWNKLRVSETDFPVRIRMPPCTKNSIKEVWLDVNLICALISHIETTTDISSFLKTFEDK
jgi:hypothetical protein